MQRSKCSEGEEDISEANQGVEEAVPAVEEVPAIGETVEAMEVRCSSSLTPLWTPVVFIN